MQHFLQTLSLTLLLILPCCAYSVTTQTHTQSYEYTVSDNTDQNNLVKNRLDETDAIVVNPFAIALYKPTYILPLYYTGSPYNDVYRGNTPENEPLKKGELKYQFSFVVPVWQHILNSRTTLYAAYTQLSYWQAYNHRAFFRETDYEPELFLSSQFDLPLSKNWELNVINLGVEHQSNGFGGPLERSWNRAYVSFVASSDHCLFIIRPWFVFHDTTYERQNPDLTHYLGHEQIVFAYKYGPHVFSLEARNLIESAGARAGITLSWSFPLNEHLKGYIQVFHGYGQSLIEYNQRTTSVGIGIALNNFI